MKDEDLPRVETLQHVGGKRWKLWRELSLSEGTAINSAYDYKLRNQARHGPWHRPPLEGKGYQKPAEALVVGLEYRKDRRQTQLWS